MLSELTFLLLPVVLSATQLCPGQNCAKTRSARIMNGYETERHTRPYQVALYSRVGTTGELGFCGASLLHPQWVLTAAHCCIHDGVQVDNVQAILGAHSLYDRYENGRRIVNVDAIEIHPEWDPETFANDVALLHLANIIQLTDTVNIVQLPPLRMVNSNFAGVRAYTTGWGIAAEGVTFVSPTLREYDMTVITDQQCNGFYQNLLPPNTICGLSIASNAGTCKGDNGGPMTTIITIDEDEEEEILIGVTSFISNSGCNIDIPSVFTRVQRYLDWISQITGIQLN